MVRLLWKRLPQLFLAAYVAIGVMGVFSFAAVDALRSLNFEAKSPMSDKIFASPDSYFIQYQAAGAAIITKTDNTQFSPLRMGFQRIASLFGPPNSGTAFSKSHFTLSANIQYADLINNIPLKLRI
jgi:hypothetical protein